MRRHVEIAGAGLAGLSLGATLAQRDWSVRIHERSAELRMFGAGIWLWENGLRALRVIGAEERSIRRAKKITDLIVRDAGGMVMWHRKFGPGDRLLVPPRVDLYDALIAVCREAGVDIVTNSTVQAAEPNGRLILADGTTVTADLVVAADGVFSRVRDSLFLIKRLDYIDEGYTRLLVPHAPEDPDAVITEYWHGKRRLLYDPCTDNVDYVALTCPLDDVEGRRIPVDKRTWTESFPSLAGLIERFGNEGRFDSAITVHCRAWSSGRAVVIGDAAHAQPPNLGQAANMAFTNVVSLAAALDSTTDIPSALREWERKERPLTEHVQRWTNFYGWAVVSWPRLLEPYRSHMLSFACRRRWLDRQLNRAARHVPVGS